MDWFQGDTDGEDFEQELRALGDALGMLDDLEYYVNYKAGERLAPGEQYFHEIQNYLHQHYREDLKVSRMAEAVNIDRTYVYRLFCKDI